MATATATRKPQSHMRRRPAVKPKPKVRKVTKPKALPMDAAATLVRTIMPSIVLAIPRNTTPERMRVMVEAELRRKPELLTATRVEECILKAARMGLEPGVLEQCHLIPRRNKAGGTECTLMIGYEGMMSIMHRSGMVRSISTGAVYRGERFEQTSGTTRTLTHVPDLRLRTDESTIIASYAVLNMKSGPPEFVVLTRQNIDKRRAAGLTNGPAWTHSYEAMARKSAIREAFKWAVKAGAIDIQGAEFDAIDVQSTATTWVEEPAPFVEPDKPSQTQTNKLTRIDLCAAAGISVEEYAAYNKKRSSEHRKLCTVARNAGQPQPPAPAILSPAEVASALLIHPIEDVREPDQKPEQDVVSGVYGLDGDGRFTKAMGSWDGKLLSGFSLELLKNSVTRMENQPQFADLKLVFEARIEELGNA